MRYILVLLIVWTGCGITPSGYWNLKYGIKQDKSVPYVTTQTDIHKGVNIIVDGFAECFEKRVDQYFDGVIFKFSDEIAPSPSTGILNTVVKYNNAVGSGFQIGKTMLVAWRGKLFRSAVAHELMHYLGRVIDSAPDPNHQIIKYWNCVKRINGRLKEANL
jgi:hypothetical protein